MLYEGVRLAAASGEPVDAAMTEQIMNARHQDIDQTGWMTAEFAEDALIRLHVLSRSQTSISTACERARARLQQIDENKRPRARLEATLQLAGCLGAIGNDDEAHRLLLPALRTCAALGLSQLLVDEGPQLLRLAKGAVSADGPGARDPAGLRDFVSDLVETPTS